MEFFLLMLVVIVVIVVIVAITLESSRTKVSASDVTHMQESNAFPNNAQLGTVMGFEYRYFADFSGTLIVKDFEWSFEIDDRKVVLAKTVGIVMQFSTDYITLGILNNFYSRFNFFPSNDVFVFPHNRDAFSEFLINLKERNFVGSEAVHTMMALSQKLLHEKDSMKVTHDFESLRQPVITVTETRSTRPRYDSSNLTELTNIDLQSVVFIDCETTSLSEPHVIEIAIVDYDGNVLLDTRISTSQIISAGAYEIHGIKSSDLHDKPKPSDVWCRVEELIRDKVICCFNAKFDIKAMELTFGKPIKNRVLCAMLLSQKLFQFERWPKLSQFPFESSRQAHTALGDSLDTCDLFRAMMKFKERIDLYKGLTELNIPRLNTTPSGTILRYESVYNRKVGGELFLGDKSVACIDVQILKKCTKNEASSFTVSERHGNKVIELLSEKYMNSVQLEEMEDWLKNTLGINQTKPTKQGYVTANIPLQIFGEISLPQVISLSAIMNVERQPNLLFLASDDSILYTMTTLKGCYKRLFALSCLGHKLVFRASNFSSKQKVCHELDCSITKQRAIAELAHK